MGDDTLCRCGHDKAAHEYEYSPVKGHCSHGGTNGVPECRCARYTPAPSPTDLPDAETAIRTILREHTHKLGVCCRCGYGEGEQFAVSEHRHRAHVASVITAALAAASGPWAEQLDTANADRDALDERVRFQRDELERQAAKLGAALARNAELEKAHRTHAFSNERNPDKCDVCGLAEIAEFCPECKRVINGRLYEHRIGHHGWGKEDN